jgi:hypothetical protein
MNGQTHAPAPTAVFGAKVQPGPERSDRITPIFNQDHHGFAHDERQIPLQAHLEPLLLVLAGIPLAGQVDPDFISANFDGKTADIIGPLVKRSPALQVEAGVVPVAGQDSVFYGSTIQGKAHMRAAVVYSINFIIVGK